MRKIEAINQLNLIHEIGQKFNKRIVLLKRIGIERNDKRMIEILKGEDKTFPSWFTLDHSTTYTKPELMQMIDYAFKQLNKISDLEKELLECSLQIFDITKI